MPDGVDVEADNIRHRQEEEARRAKRKEAREKKSTSQLEKEARRKEHAQRVLQQQQQKHTSHRGPTTAGSSHPPSSNKKSPAPPSTAPPSSSLIQESKFQALLAKRSEGFLIDFLFRNAPPRPPVGPCFVGLGLDGELNDKWTRYKPQNAVELSHVWKLHSEADLGVPLAPTAINIHYYMDPMTHIQNRNRKEQENHPNASKTKQNIDQSMFDDDDDDFDKDEKEEKRNPTVQDYNVQGSAHENKMQDESDRKKEIKTHPGAIVTTSSSSSSSPSTSLLSHLHPDDIALLHWKGSLGDTAAEALKVRRDRARALARLPKGSTSLENNNNNTNKTFKVKQRDNASFTSRVLDERHPFFMKKTTYLSNDTSQSVHAFKSLAEIRMQTAMELERKLQQQQASYGIEELIDKSFQVAKDHARLYQKNQDMKDKDGTTTQQNDTTGKRSHRVHPTKKNVHAVAEYPLFPDVATWGNTYVHLVMDNLPKKVGNVLPPTYKQLCHAVIMDVKNNNTDISTRMECNVLVPSDSNLPTTETKQNRQNYTAAHKYDLDVIHVKDEDSPPVTFVLVIDEESGVAMYHPVSSRVNLSGGRPALPRDKKRKNVVGPRDMNHEELEEIERKKAHVDWDIAEKYGIFSDYGQSKNNNTRESEGENAMDDSDKNEEVSMNRNNRVASSYRLGIYDADDDDDSDE